MSDDPQRLEQAKSLWAARVRTMITEVLVFLLALGGMAISAAACEGVGGPELTTLTTSLSGEGKEGTTITVLEGSKVKDKATLKGKNAATATGKVTYKVYSESECKTLVTSAGEVTVSGESVPASSEEELEGGKTYYWQAHYGGDSKNAESTSECNEILTVKAKTALSTKLSGESKEGEELTVLEGSKAKDKATLAGTNSSTAGGKVVYKVYSDSKCEHLVTEAGEETVTSGSVPASNEEELEGGKAYYWQATYKGDSLHQESTSTCGKEILSVEAKTSLSTKLSGESKEGEELTVLEGSKAKDKATLAGTNSSTAGGKVVYKVYSDSKCEHLVTEAGEETVTSGSVPASSEEELEGGKTYYWQATYKGDSLHQESTSTCGSEILKVTAAEWSAQEPPGPSGPTGSYLDGVSCTSSTACTAVGYFRTSREDIWPFAERWNGTEWSAHEGLSVPTGPNKASYLDGVSCASSTACVAVGEYEKSSGKWSLFAEKWNGAEWSLQEPPNPVGAKESFLDGVSCTSSTECVAIGSFVNSSERDVPLAEKWNGTTWSVQEPPSPAESVGVEMYSVSCTSSTACIASGEFLSESIKEVPFVEKWNGTEWSVQEPPTPVGVKESYLKSVSCTSSTACIAVGYSNGEEFLPLAEKWNGTEWSVQEPPVPVGTKKIIFLKGVSCTSSTKCIAVGFFVNKSEQYMPFVESWNGTEWSLQEPSTPAGAKESYLESVSCTSSTACMAVGQYANSSEESVPLAEKWNGTEWSPQEPPASPGPESSLDGVSCTSSTACTAVGYFKTSRRDLWPFAESWNGTEWSAQEPPIPTGTTDSSLDGVSCASSTACIAVGTYAKSPEKWSLFAEKWNGTEWSLQEPPLPAGGREGIFDGVSCTSSTECVAIGSFMNSSESFVSLVEKWNGTTWSAQELPSPAKSLGSGMYSVSCTSSTACIASGEFLSEAMKEVPFVEKWNGTEWSVQEPPTPVGVKESYLKSVSCTSSTACVAVGYSNEEEFLPFAEKWNGTEWSLQEPPVPVGTKKIIFLKGVSCTSSTKCIAVGFFLNSSEQYVPFAEKWNGTEWSLQEPPTPVGAHESYLEGVSCTSSTACTAVGQHTNSSEEAMPLVERLS